MVLVAVLLIARVGAVLLLATGVSTEVAKFQAFSALTGVGFTTDEAATVITHPVRRRIILSLMLIGNAGFATIVASLTISFVTSDTSADVIGRILFALLGVLSVAVLAKSQRLERGLSNGLSAAVARFTDLDVRDYHHLMQLTNDYAITELHISFGDWLADKKLVDLHLPDEGVLVLAVMRADGQFLGAPKGHTEIHPNDMLVLYGRADVIAELDGRPASFDGDRAHDQAVADNRALLDALLDAGAHT